VCGHYIELLGDLLADASKLVTTRAVFLGFIDVDDELTPLRPREAMFLKPLLPQTQSVAMPVACFQDSSLLVTE